MKVEKFYKKVEDILDNALEQYGGTDARTDKFRYLNDDSGVYFTVDGVILYHLPNSHVATAKKNDAHDMGYNGYFKRFFAYAMDNGVLADTVECGKVYKYKARRFQNEKSTVYVAEKLLKKFPANADYFLTGATTQVGVCIWENGQSYPIAVVMPIRVGDDCDFIPNEGEKTA